jgi:hypothetical protein
VIDVLRADWLHQQLRCVSDAVLSNKAGAACEICAAIERAAESARGYVFAKD